jgi:hypothetical protein
MDVELAPPKYQAHRSAQHHLSIHLIPSDAMAGLPPLVDPPYTEWSQSSPLPFCTGSLHLLPWLTSPQQHPSLSTLSLSLSLSLSPFPAL